MSQTPPATTVESLVCNIPSESSSIRSRRSFSVRINDSDRIPSITSSPADHHQQHHHYHHHHHHYNNNANNNNNLLHPQSDVSWDEDTSSTSGYRESYSMQLMSIDGTKSSHVPPLASPDLNDIPSTSSTATNYMGYDGSSPDCSLNGSGGEKTALLNSGQRTESQHSLLMVFQAQDEDTLI